MIRYFIRHYWRYLAMALAFATISFMINSCEVKAEVRIQTFELNHFFAGNEQTHVIYSATNTLKNYGRGRLIFSFSIYRYMENATFMIPNANEVQVNTGDSIFTCQLGTTSNGFEQSDVLKVNMYSVVCDVNIGSQGIRSITVKNANTVNNNWNLVTSQYATFTSDIEFDINSYLSTINSTIANYIGTTNSLIASKLDTLNAHQTVIQNILNTNIPLIVSILQGQTTAINNQTQTQHQDAQSQKESTDAINDSINDSSTDDPTNDIEDMDEQVASNSVISDLLLLPVNLFQRILNSINGTCANFNLGTLLGTNLILPCINLENLLGSALWTTIDILFCGIFILTIRKKFVDIFENITSLKDRGNEIE